MEAYNIIREVIPGLTDAQISILLKSAGDESLLLSKCAGFLSKGTSSASSSVLRSACEAVQLAACIIQSSTIPSTVNSGGGVDASGGNSGGVVTAPTKRSKAPPPPLAIPVKRQDPVSSERGPPPPPCECYATSHPLFALCLNCGKILCDLEKFHKCVSCGFLLGGYVESSSAEDVARAYAQRDKLLHFDKTCAQRTVVKDESDYIPTSGGSHWLSKEEEAEEAGRLERLRSAGTPRSSMRISIDIASQRAVDIDREELAARREKMLASITAQAPLSTSAAVSDKGGGGGEVVRGNFRATQPPRGAVGTSKPSALGTGVFLNSSLQGTAAEIYRDLLLDAKDARAAAGKASPKARRAKR